MEKELSEILKEYVSVKEKKIKFDELKVRKLTYLQLRDAIWKIGRVVVELEEDKVYIAAIKSGSLGKNMSYLAIKLLPGRLEIVGYAKEGLFNQNTVEKSIEKLGDVLNNKTIEGVKSVKRHQRLLRILLLIVVLLTTCIIVGYFCFISPAIKATEKYNEAVNTYNEMSGEYDSALENTSVDNIEGIASSAGTLQAENTDIFSVIKAVITGNSAEKISNDTDTIYQIMDSMKDDLQIVAQITNPSSEWIIEKLDTIEQIEECEAVSEDNDSNQMLNKESGYTACVYFTISDIESDSVEGDTVVDKGTDTGGAIEVYSSVEDAEARCEYLSDFDNTLLYSGSYAIVGTMIVRTSYRLDDGQQLALTNKIVKAFTVL